MIFRKSILPILALVTAAGPALSAPCSNTGAEYESWKPVMAQEAAAAGVGERGLAALMGSSYASKTIAADRNQKSFKYSLDKFLQAYAVERAKAEARRHGHQVVEQQLPNGSIKLTVQVGGAS